MKKIISMLLVLSIICLVGCSNTESVNDDIKQETQTEVVALNNTKKFKESFIKLAEENAKKTNNPLPKKWDGTPSFILDGVTVTLPIKTQIFLDLTGYTFLFTGDIPNRDNEWGEKLIESNKIDSYYSIIKVAETDKNGKTTKVSAAMLSIYNPYEEPTIARECYIIGIQFGNNEDTKLLTDEENTTFPNVTINSLQIKPDTSIDDIKKVLGETTKFEEFHYGVKGYWFYTGSSGKFVVATIDNKIHNIDCIYKMPIDEESIAFSENIPLRELWDNFEIK